MSAGPWRRCDPGDGSPVYFFNLDTHEAIWVPPEGIPPEVIPDFAVEDEEAAGIEDEEEDDEDRPITPPPLPTTMEQPAAPAPSQEPSLSEPVAPVVVAPRCLPGFGLTPESGWPHRLESCGAWSLSAGTVSSHVGTMHHPIRGGSASSNNEWVERHTPSRGLEAGDAFYVNLRTGETSWERPQARHQRAHPTDGGTDPSPLDAFECSHADDDPDEGLDVVLGLTTSKKGSQPPPDLSMLLVRVGVWPELLGDAWEAVERARADAGIRPHRLSVLPTIPVHVPPTSPATRAALGSSLSSSLFSSGGGADDSDDGSGSLSASSSSGASMSSDVIVAALRGASGGGVSVTGLYRRLASLLVLVQTVGNDDEWLTVISSRGRVVPRWVLSCIAPLMPPAVTTVAAQLLFLFAQLDSECLRLLITDFTTAHTRGTPVTAAGSGEWRCWAGLGDAVGAGVAGLCAALHGWRLRWPKAPRALVAAATAATATSMTVATTPQSAGSTPGLLERSPSTDGAWPAVASNSAASAVVDREPQEEQLLTWALVLDNCLGASVLEPLTDADLRTEAWSHAPSSASSASVARSRVIASADPSRDALGVILGRADALALATVAAAGSASPGSTAQHAAVAALASAVEVLDTASRAAKPPSSAGLLPPIPGVTRALLDSHALHERLAAAVLAMIIGVGGASGAGGSSDATSIAPASGAAAVASTTASGSSATASADGSSGAAAQGVALRATLGLVRRLLSGGAAPPLFYTTDLRVLIDVLLRELQDRPEQDEIRADLLLLLRDILLHTQWVDEGRYRCVDIAHIVTDLVASGAADAAPQVRAAAEALFDDCSEILSG